MPPKQKIPIHDVSPILQKLREFLLGRKHTLHTRSPELWASRSVPPPNLPDGDAHKLKDNYYFSRNIRGQVKPPEIISGRAKKIVDVCKADIEKITPGKLWRWD
ncbi:unnamed protein product [Ceutorhynchus assimilis]|uniref:NADH dehydrogenase [ubiquinone] 1 alpha subcomplex subunit 7 n=1 Tax=Ceutorhynchus assimilis TaxID=467358 RepID=A0A9N9QPI0_9CUCU|nr:unnamed protein product [Ceutorhynchus assimilis]